MRWTLLGLGALLLLGCAAAFALAFTPLLDHRLMAGFDVSANEAMRGRFHRGDGPCLRYRPREVAPVEVETVAQALLKAGVGSRLLGDLAREDERRAFDQEKAHHALDEADELLEAAAENARGADRLLVALKRGRMRKQLTAMLLPSAVLGSTTAPLSADQRTEVDRLWAAYPAVLVVPGLVRLLQRMHVLETEQQLDRLSAELTAKVAEGQVPESMLDLGIAPEDGHDAWGYELTYAVEEGKISLASLGSDGARGGTGDAADLVREVAVPVAPDAGVPVLGDPMPGGPPPSRVSLRQADVDDALEHTDRFANEARLVPFFVDGKPVGFKVFAIHSGSLYAKLGLHNGDVVTAIEDMPLTSPDRVLEVYEKVRKAKQLSFTLERGGAPYTVHVDVH